MLKGLCMPHQQPLGGMRASQCAQAALGSLWAQAPEHLPLLPITTTH